MLVIRLLSLLLLMLPTNSGLSFYRMLHLLIPRSELFLSYHKDLSTSTRNSLLSARYGQAGGRIDSLNIVQPQKVLINTMPYLIMTTVSSGGIKLAP